ncbi:MAG: ribosome maturation factor RimM [Acidimicrobiia bacterium]
MTEQVTIPVGYVRRAHGIRGDVVVRGLGADAVERFQPGAMVTTNESPARTFEVAEHRPHSTDFIVHLSDVEDRTAAEGLVGVQFVIDPTDRRELDPNEWWIEDIVGCIAVDPDGLRVGTVTDVIVGPAQDRLVLSVDGGGRAEVPLVDELVPEVSITDQRVVVALIEGLIEGAHQGNGGE